jgi:ribose 5-phosphate isomerase B
MRVHIATDHAAFETKQFLVESLRAKGYEIIDHGASALNPDDDYPATVIPCAEAVRDDPGSLGVVLGGSGNGEQIAANKVTGIRAALAYDISTAQLAREHNDAQIVSLGGRMHTLQEALGIVLVFLETPFSLDPRHQRRIDLITEYENTGQITPA